MIWELTVFGQGAVEVLVGLGGARAGSADLGYWELRVGMGPVTGLTYRSSQKVRLCMEQRHESLSSE